LFVQARLSKSAEEGIKAIMGRAYLCGQDKIFTFTYAEAEILEIIGVANVSIDASRPTLSRTQYRRAQSLELMLQDILSTTGETIHWCVGGCDVTRIAGVADMM
jgi:hypothetical protein